MQNSYRYSKFVEKMSLLYFVVMSGKETYISKIPLKSPRCNTAAENVMFHVIIWTQLMITMTSIAKAICLELISNWTTTIRNGNYLV